MRKSWKPVALTATAISIFASPTANADWFRGGASLCKEVSPYSTLDRPNNAVESGGLVGGTQVICPLYEKDGLRRSELSHVKLWVRDRDATDSVEAQLCRRSYSGGQATCTPMLSSGNSFTGTYIMGQSGTNSSTWQNWSTWTSSNSGFSYIFVRLTSDPSPSNRSRIYGYHMRS